MMMVITQNIQGIHYQNCLLFEIKYLVNSWNHTDPSRKILLEICFKGKSVKFWLINDINSVDIQRMLEILMQHRSKRPNSFNKNSMLLLLKYIECKWNFAKWIGVQKQLSEWVLYFVPWPNLSLPWTRSVFLGSFKGQLIGNHLYERFHAFAL